MEVVNITITYGSKFAIAIVKDSEKVDSDHLEIIGYSLNSFNKKWSMSIDGTLPDGSSKIDGVYIKTKLIEQSDDGKTLAICYQDDGAFHVRVLSAEG